MFDPRLIGRDFSAAAADYDMHATLQRHVLSALADKALPQITNGARLLDAGCGTGQFAKRAAGFEVTQIDVAFAMCRRAAERGVSVVNASITALPFPDATFDGVFSSLVLQWIPDPAQAMNEMRRVLKPGGLLAVSTFGPGTLRELKESFAAADRYSHVSSFTARDAFAEHETVTEHYPDLLAIMRHLKIIGARNKLMGRRRSLTTPRQMERVARRYEERFGTPSGLPVTWEILYSVMRV